MSAFRRRLKKNRPPEGWELIEEVIEDFENQMKEAVNEEHEGKRKAELNYKIHRIHWEKNRFIYDLMYQRKIMSRELFDYLVREKIADGALISKWRKPGYEILCSMLAIQKGNHNFGTTSHCRVPLRKRAPAQRIAPDIQTGCISCCSGDGRFGGPIWWNTPLEEEEAQPEDNRTVWKQPGEPTTEPVRKKQKTEAEEAQTQEGGVEDESGNAEDQVPPAEGDDIPEDVQKRLEALKKSMGH